MNTNCMRDRCSTARLPDLRVNAESRRTGLASSIGVLLAAATVALVTACDDNGGGGEAPPEPESYIITSGFGTTWHVLSGDDYSEIANVQADYVTGFPEGVQDAIMLPGVEGFQGPVAIYLGMPESDYGNPQVFYSGALDGEGSVMMSDLDRPMGGLAPAGELGFIFVAADAERGIYELVHSRLGDTSIEPIKDIDFQKVIDGDTCSSWGGFQSPSYSPAGVGYAAGWSCKHEDEGSDLHEYITVLAFDSRSGDCGDPLWVEQNRTESIIDTCYTTESSLVIFSVGALLDTKRVFAAAPDGSVEAFEITDAFNGGDFMHFSCDPTSNRIVFNDIEVNPNLFVLDYELGDGSISFTGDAEQITTDGVYRRPRWVAAH